MTQPSLDVHGMVAELTTSHQHRERYAVQVGATTWGGHHVTRVPPLIHQLQHASPSGEGLGRSGAYESRPVARVEAFDTFVRIDHAAARWVRDLGEDDPGDQLEVVGYEAGPQGPVCTARCSHRSCAAIRRGVTPVKRPIPGSGTIACIRRLHALMASVDRCQRRGPRREHGRVVCCTWHQAEADIIRWWTQARVVTGWDSPPWRPDATCPMCGVRGSLRIRLEDRSAVCAECHETWDSSSYQQLAEHVRTEADTRKRARLTLVREADVDVDPRQNRGW